MEEEIYIKKKEIILEARKQGKTAEQIAEENPEYFKDAHAVNGFICGTLKKDKEAYGEYLQNCKVEKVNEKYKDYLNNTPKEELSHIVEKKKEIILQVAKQGKTMEEIAEENLEYFRDAQAVHNFIRRTLKRDKEVYEEYLKSGDVKRKSSVIAEKKKEIIVQAIKQGKTREQIAQENPEYFKDIIAVYNCIKTTLKKDEEAYEEYLQAVEEARKARANLNKNTEQRIRNIKRKNRRCKR